MDRENPQRTGWSSLVTPLLLTRGHENERAVPIRGNRLESHDVAFAFLEAPTGADDKHVLAVRVLLGPCNEIPALAFYRH